MHRLAGGLSWRQISPPASLPGIGIVPLLIGAQQPPGLHRCSQTTIWWSFIADSSASKSLLLSSLFWFMYFLIYLCMWTKGGQKRRGIRRGVKRRKTATATMLATIPGGTPVVHLPFKGFSNRRAQCSSRALQSLVCGSQATLPHLSPPPESIGTVCMFCMLRQKRYSFSCALALWRGLNGAAHRCGNYKNQRQEKKMRRMLLLPQNPPQTRAITPEQGFWTQYARLSSVFACLWNGRDEPLEASGRTGTEEQTNLLRKEGSFKELTLMKWWSLAEMQSLWQPSSLQLLSKRSVEVGPEVWECLRLLGLL